MLRENIEARCRKISPDAYSEKSVCAFAPKRSLVGFIDTSATRDGSQGIALLGDRMLVKAGGELREVEYKKIVDLHIIQSFEDAFADELSVAAKGMTELRISDCSLDKSELKSLLDELRHEQVGRQVESYAERFAKRLAEHAKKPQRHDAERIEKAARERRKPAPKTVERQPVIEEIAAAPVIYEETPLPVIVETAVDIPEERVTIPEDYEPSVIPEGDIEWISGKRTVGATATAYADDVGDIEEIADSEDNEIISDIEDNEEAAEVEDNGEPDIADAHPKETRPKLPEVLNGVIDRTPVVAVAKKPESEPENPEQPENNTPEPQPEEDESMTMLSESEMRERIENMSANEMMEFLTETLSEINGGEETEIPEEPSQEEPPTAEQEEVAEPAPESAPELPPTRWKKLTVEPIWGDIYIKASSSLRQLCESGKLTMEQMEDELRGRLLIAAEAFEKLTGDGSRVPKVMIPKITELKLAADNFDSYFSYGEDIAIRAMFFMLYQMLTYADRIAESPETKASLNDFFRRFGSAGITLSMLDMRV